MDGAAFREARKLAGLPLNDVADRLGVSASYLSHIESGRKRLPPSLAASYGQIVQAMARPDEFSLSGRVIDQFRNFRPYQKHTWRRATGRRLGTHAGAGNQASDKATRFRRFGNSPPDLVALFGKMADFDLEDLPSKTRTTLIWHRAGSYDGTIIGSHYESIVQKCIDYDIWFSHYIIPDTTQVEADLLWLLDKALRYVYFRNYIQFDTIKALTLGMFDMDFFVVADNVASIRLATSSFDRRKSGIVLTEPMQVAPLVEYVRRIENHRDYAISVFLGELDLARFFDAYAAVSYQAGPKLLAQQFLGSFTLPADYFRPSSTWWVRYETMGKTIRGFDVELLANSRMRALAELRTRLSSFPVRQICSLETMEAWARCGVRPDIETRRVVDRPEDRRARLDHVLHLLREFERFEIALLSDKAGEHLGWKPVFGEGPAFNFTKARSVSWLTQGRSTVLESIIPTHDESSGMINREGEGLGALEKVSEFQCIIADDHLAQDFSALFNQTWRSIPARQRNKADVIAFFESLRLRIQS